MKAQVAGETGPDLVEVLDKELTPAVIAGAVPIDAATWESALIGLARDLLSRPGKQFRARLVRQAWELAGGRGELSPLLPHVVELVHAGSLIVDDIEDDSDSRRGAPALHRRYGLPLALNTGNWLYFAAFHLLERCGLGDAVVLDLYRRLSATLFRCHQGQALDLSIDVSSLRQRDIEDLARSVAALKTGALMQLAAELGAAAARAPEPATRALGEFGSALGTALQHLDDLGGIRSPARIDKGLEDLESARLTWPWAYLSRRLDEVGFAHLQSDLRRARAEGTCEALLLELRERLGPGASEAAAAQLGEVLRPLERAFADHPALAGLEAELERLERSYG